MKNTLLTLVAVTLLTSVLVVQAKQEGAGNTTSKTFKVAAETKILTADGKAAALADLKVGDKIALAYKDAAGTLTADSIHVMADTGSKKGEGHKAANADGAIHAHGVITAIDKTAGTITVDVKQPHKKSQP
jgi:hypothetical protein